METVDPVAGIVLSDSFSAAKAVAECRVFNRRRGDAPFPARGRRRTVIPSFHCSRAAVLVALNGGASLAAAGSRLLVSSSADATSRRPRCRALLSAGRRIVILPVGCLSAATSLVLLSTRDEEPLDALRHLSTFFALVLV